MALQSRFLIFFHFLCLDTWMNIQTVCFSSESMLLLCSRDVNQKYFKAFHWFPNHLLHIDDGNIKFSYIYMIEMQKSSFWKTSVWNATLIYTFNKNNSKNNNKKQDNQSFWEISSKRNNFINQIIKMFILYTLNDIASFNFLKFTWFKQSINTLKFKASASKSFCFYFLLLPNL